jgi:hypothetical protein
VPHSAGHWLTFAWVFVAGVVVCSLAGVALCEGLRSVFLPDSFGRAEPAHSWQHGQTALVLGVWAVASLMVCVRTFRAFLAGTTPYGNAWDRGTRFWYAYYGVTFSIALAVLFATHGSTAREKVIAGLALVAMAAWYATAGRVVTRGSRPEPVRETIYR